MCDIKKLGGVVNEDAGTFCEKMIGVKLPIIKNTYDYPKSFQTVDNAESLCHNAQTL